MTPVSVYTRRRTRTRVHAVATAAALAAIVGFGASNAGVWVPIALVLFGTVGGLHLWAAWRHYHLPWHPILVPMLAFGALVTWQAITPASAYPGQTVTELCKLAACGCIFWLGLFGGRSERSLRRFVQVLWWFTALLAAEAIVQLATAGGYIYWFHDASYATPVGPFVYHNHFAGCMDLLIPLAVAVSFQTRGRRLGWSEYLLRGLVPALALAAVVLSQSRGGTIALLVEGVAGLALFWPTLMSTGTRSRTVLIAVALIAFTGLGSWAPLVARLSKLRNHDVSATDRLAVAAACWRIWKSAPWTGTGFGTFASVYPRFQSFDSGQQILQAHNDYAQALAETGVVGAGLVLTFLAIFVADGLRRGAMAGNLVPLQRAMLIGCLGFLVHSMGDFEFHSQANALLFFLLAGTMLAAREVRPKPGPATSPAATLRVAAHSHVHTVQP